MSKKYNNPEIESSYRLNDLGFTLYEIVRQYKPEKIVEFGVLHGYSTVAMAMALQDNKRGRIYAYDIWTKYPYKNAKMSETATNIALHGVGEQVELLIGDCDSWEPELVDFIVLDIGNDGTIIKKYYEKWKDYCKFLIFEGGSLERDEVDWMLKYDKKPIRDCGVDYAILNSKFPSVSIIKCNL